MIGSFNAALSLLAGILSLALSLVVLRLDWRGEVNRVFSLWSALIALANFTGAAIQYDILPDFANLLTRLFCVVLVFIVSFLVHVAYIVPEGPKRAYTKVLIHLPAVPMAALVLWTDLLIAGPSLDPSSSLPIFGPLVPLGVEYLVAYPFLGLGFLLKAYLEAPEHKKVQLKSIMGGVAFWIIGNPLIFLLFLPSIAFPVFTLNAMAMSLFFAYAIFTHRITFKFETLTTSFQNILQSLTDGIVVINREGRIAYSNKAFRESTTLSGWSIDGEDFRRAFGTAETANWMESLSPVMEKGKTTVFENVRYRGPGGKEVVCNIKVQPLRDTTGYVIGALATIEYLTEKVRLEEELEEYARLLEDKVEERTKKLQKAYEDLKELDKMKEEFVSNITHELKTPVTITKASLELAMDESSAEERTKFFAMSMEGLARLERLLDDLLNVAKMEKGVYHISPVPLDLGHTIEKTATEIGPLAESQDVKLRVIPMQGPIKVLADEDALRRIFLNLFQNGIKFNKKGGEVVVEASVNSGLAEVKVSDTGAGIPKESLEKVFDRFYQVEGGLNRRYPGTGLGLAITRELVELQKGRIRVESDVGNGSTFIFTIPLAVE